METHTITGGCYCGEVHFQRVVRRSCPGELSLCQLRSSCGSSGGSLDCIKRSHFQFTKGTPHRYQTETSAWRTFCPYCGTSLTYEHNKRADEIDITTGSLDHPEDFPPTKDVYPEERLPWVELIRD